MIRSVYEYNHREWSMRYGEFKFSGRPIVDLSEHEAKAALAFMVQFAGDTQNRLRMALELQNHAVGLLGGMK